MLLVPGHAALLSPRMAEGRESTFPSPPQASLANRETRRAPAAAATSEKKGLEESGQEMAPAVQQSLTRPVPVSAAAPDTTAQTHRGHDASGDGKRREKGSPATAADLPAVVAPRRHRP